MNKVIKITDDEVLIGKDDGSIIKTEKSNATWDVKVGDEVELFTSGETVILNLAKKAKEKKEKGFVNGVVRLCQKMFLISFTSLFALFMVALIVIGMIPRGNKYTYNAEIMGMELSATVSFKGDEMSMKMTGDEEIIVSKYKIESKKLYEYNTETSAYDCVGEISSTKITYKIDLGEDGSFNMVFKENTMITLRTLSIVCMIIFAVLDLAALTVMILTKKGIIKLSDSRKVEVLANSQNEDSTVTE